MTEEQQTEAMQPVQDDGFDDFEETMDFGATAATPTFADSATMAVGDATYAADTVTYEEPAASFDTAMYQEPAVAAYDSAVDDFAPVYDEPAPVVEYQEPEPDAFSNDIQSADSTAASADALWEDLG